MSRPILLITLVALALPQIHAQAPLHVFVSPNLEVSGNFGRVVASVPDTDGDGRDDLLVGAVREDGGAPEAGRAYLFSGATGLVLHTLVSPDPEPNGQFGNSVAGVPDADGDGRGDLLVGASAEDGGAPGAGRAYLFSGATGLALHTLVSPDPEEGGRFGYSVASESNTAGGGRSDLLVGAPRESGRRREAGRAHLFRGATGVRYLTLESPFPHPDDEFGHAVAIVSDADGDGLGDLLVAAPREGGTVANDGAVHLFNGLTGTRLFTLNTPNYKSDGRFGHSIAGVPDADGDGFGDFLVGAEQEDYKDIAGRAHLFSGGTGDFLYTLVSPHPEFSGLFGESVAGVSDADGDGRGDLLVAAPGEGSEGGQAYLYSGATGTLLRTLVSANPDADSYFGYSVAGVKDVDGDGRGDLLIGASGEDGGAERSGRAYLFSGATPVATEPMAPALGFVLAVSPNPARGAATLRLTLDRPQAVTVSVSDALGRRVALLHEGPLAAGTHALPFDTAALSAGVYVVRATGGTAAVTRRVVVAR